VEEHRTNVRMVVHGIVSAGSRAAIRNPIGAISRGC
jgi:hypothetical protein